MRQRLARMNEAKPCGFMRGVVGVGCRKTIVLTLVSLPRHKQRGNLFRTLRAPKKTYE